MGAHGDRANTPGPPASQGDGRPASGRGTKVKKTKCTGVVPGAEDEPDQPATGNETDEEASPRRKGTSAGDAGPSAQSSTRNAQVRLSGITSTLREFERGRVAPQRMSESARVEEAVGTLQRAEKEQKALRWLLGAKPGNWLRPARLKAAGITAPIEGTKRERKCEVRKIAVSRERHIGRKVRRARERLVRLRDIENSKRRKLEAAPKVKPPPEVLGKFFQVYDTAPEKLSASAEENRTASYKAAAEAVQGDSTMLPVEITAGEVKAVFAKYATRSSAPGPSGVDYKGLNLAIKKKGGMADEIAGFVNAMLKTSRDATVSAGGKCPEDLGEDVFPTSWLNSKVCLIPKTENTASTQPQDWRPVTLSNSLLKGVSEVLREKCLKFLRTSGPGGGQGYTCEGYVPHTLEKDGSSETAGRMLRVSMEQALREGKAWVAVASDVSNAFGSVDMDTIFDALHTVYRIEPGTAAFLALVTKKRQQTLGPLPPRTAQVGTAQGKPDSGQIFNLVFGVPILASKPAEMSTVQSSFSDDATSFGASDSIRGAAEQAQKWCQRVEDKMNPLNLFFHPKKSAVIALDFRKKTREGQTKIRYPTKSEWRVPISMKAKGAAEKEAVPLLVPESSKILPRVGVIKLLGTKIAAAGTDKIRKWGLSLPKPLVDPDGKQKTLKKGVTDILDSAKCTIAGFRSLS